MKRWERIRNHYLNPETEILTSEDKKYESVLWKAYSLLEQSDSITIAANTYKSQLDTDATMPTIYKWFRECQLVFGSILEYKKDFVRNFVIQNLINDVKRAEKMVQYAEDNDMTGVWKTAMERKEKANLALIKARGLDKPEDEQIEFDKLEGNVYVISVDARFQKETIKMLDSAGSIDLSEQYKAVIEDIEYEEESNGSHH